MNKVAIAKCENYSPDNVRAALTKVLEYVDGLDFVEMNTVVVIKANLVSFMKPESAATTHPSMLIELTKILMDKGASVIIGDSPGGLYNSTFVNRVYSAAGMKKVENAGGILNQDFSTKQTFFEQGRVLNDFEYTAYLDKADAIINFCKLKTHGMMAMSAAAKNMFGVIPGIVKPQYHYRFPNPADFARMIIDINDYFKPVLNIVDAVDGMQGNGPTQGSPRHIGAVIAGKNAHHVDMVCARLIGLGKDDVPTLQAAYERGYVPKNADEISVNDNLDDYIVKDFELVTTKNSVAFLEGENWFVKISGTVLKAVLSSRPVPIISDCVGCGECAKLCPAKAIKMKNGKPIIDRKRCISCFCCQEFCPKGAMKVKRPLPARLLK